MSTIASTAVRNSLREISMRCYALIPIKYRMSRKYYQIKKFLERSQWWEQDKINNWQLQRLKQIIKYSYKNVPGYYFLQKESGIRPEDIKKLEDLKHLPFVTKELIRDNLADFTSRTIPEHKRMYVTTSGSTGIPFGFYKLKITSAIETAFIHTSWERSGWRLGDRSAVLRGRFVGSEKEFWQYNTMHRELILSSYYLTEKTYGKYIQKILEYNPSHLMAYPSAAFHLADVLLSTPGTNKIKFKNVFMGSENIYEWQKQKILKAFPTARLFGWYGHTEKVILAPMCEYSDDYHVWPFYGYTEVLDENNEEVSEGKVGELIGTSFWSYATPFIRYRTMDMARKGKLGHDKCGRNFQLLESVEGRVQDTLISKIGRYIPVPSTSIHSDVFNNVNIFQFSQDSRGKVLLRIVKKDSYSNRDTVRLYDEIKHKLGEDMELEIVFVDHISKTSTGKYRVLDQKLPIGGGNGSVL